MKRSQKQQFKIRKWSVFLILVCTMVLVLWPNQLNNGQYTINPIVDDKYSANSMSALKAISRHKINLLRHWIKNFSRKTI